MTSFMEQGSDRPKPVVHLRPGRLGINCAAVVAGDDGGGGGRNPEHGIFAPFEKEGERVLGHIVKPEQRQGLPATN